MYRVLLVCMSAAAVLCSILLANLALGGPPAQSREIALRFDRTALKSVSSAGRDFLVLRQPRCIYPADPVGAPAIPARHVRVLVPRDSGFQKVTITHCKTEKLPGKFDLDFVRQECPPGTEPPESKPDPQIYGNDAPFPAEKVEFLRFGIMRGFGILLLRVNPIQYLPKSKELLFHSEITLRVEYATGEETTTTVRPRTTGGAFRNLLARSVDNPGDIDALADATVAAPSGTFGPLAGGGPVEYLIICSESYSAAFQPLADWKKQKGVPSRIVTVESIESDYTGADTQEKIKNCIIDYVNENGTVYVLLGGDTDTVPHRQCYLRAYYYTEYAPCDSYYAGLDDIDWNDDDDGRCAELESDGDTIDLESDVFVGRCSCRSTADVDAFVAKTIEYEKQVPGTGFAREMLLSGIMTWNMLEGKSDVHTWSLRMYDDCIAPYWPHGMTEFFDTTLSPDLTASMLKSEIDKGYNLFNMMTHGETTGWAMEDWGTYGAGEAGSQTNDCECGLVYTIACNTNWFDSSCMSEALMRNPNGGAVAYIGCSRFGWGDPQSYLGGRSIILNRTFYVKLLGDDLHHLGQAYAAHKWEHAGECDEYNPYRWIQLGINLLGDPELPVWTDDPQTMTADYPPEIATGSQTISVKTEPGAHVCFWKTAGATDEVYVYGDTDAKGGYSAVIDPATLGTLKLTVTKHNFYPFEADITVTDSPSLYVATAVLPDGETGAVYAAALEAGGGTPPYLWTVSAGVPPDGLGLNGSAIEGTPLATGEWTFTVTVEDASYDTATREFSVAVALDTPQLEDFATPECDGNYTACWTGSDAPTHYELQEAAGFTDTITDDAESGTGLWDMSGFVISSARANSSAQSFYGGNDHDMNNTMTYAGAITAGGAAQVAFWCWYDIESGSSTGSDFAFFEVSLNDGSTWIRVRTYGGSSGGWVQETLDLSAYAGQSIRIRFRYYTTHEDISEGFYVDDVEITGLSVYDWTVLSSSISEKYYDITGRGLGTYYYRVRAFSGADESAWSEIKSVTVEEPQADLYDGGAHTVGTTTIYAGEAFTMGLETGCSGGLPVPAHSTGFFVSTDDIITTGDRLIGEYLSSGFDGSSETQSVSVPFPADIPEGTYYIGAIIDSGGDVGETDENNNAVLFAQQVTVLAKYVLTAGCSGSGLVTIDPDQPLYDPGDEVTLTAVPYAGWHFDSWEGDISSTENPLILSIGGDTTVTAVFSLTEYTVILCASGSGTTSISPGQATYHYRDQVTLSAAPEAGWTFSGWEGDLTGSENPVVIDIDDDKTVTACFAPPYVPVKKDSGGCSCSLAQSRGATPEPEVVAGYFLPLLLMAVCALCLRKRRRDTCVRKA